MNDLDLPSRRELPADVRDRIRTAVHAEPPTPRAVRWRAPLAVAASVAVLVAAAVLAVRPADDVQAGAAEPITSGDLTLTQPDAQTEEDLDRCADVVAGSPLAYLYAPRETWVPVFTVRRQLPRGDVMTVTEGNPPTTTLVASEREEVRIVAFRQKDDQPVFCEFWQNSVLLSYPGAPPITLARNDDADIHAVYWGHPHSILVGVARGVTAMDSRLLPSGERPASTLPTLVHDGLFAMQTEGLVMQDRVEVVGYDSAGRTAVSGGRAFDQTISWPVGAGFD